MAAPTEPMTVPCSAIWAQTMATAPMTNRIATAANSAQPCLLSPTMTPKVRTQAAAIIGYSDAGFRRFLVSVCYPIIDWPGNPNWHASFADSKLAIAAYVGDKALWADAKAYFYKRIAQSIYHATYDGNKVRPLLNANGTPSIAATRNHWGGGSGESAQQINTDLTPINPALFPSGTNAERTRDLGHVSMGLGAWMHGARTILAQGNTLEAHARDRLRAAYAHHAQRVLAYMNTGVIPAPTTARGDGGTAYLTGWFGACTLFGANTPADVQTLCRHAQVTGFAAAGANHLVAEAFADRNLALCHLRCAGWALVPEPIERGDAVGVGLVGRRGGVGPVARAARPPGTVATSRACS